MNKAILKLLQERYFLSNETCWEDVAKRVSFIYDSIQDHIVDMEFIPSSPTLMNANTNGERVGTLSSCFPMDVEDSIEGIGRALTECMEVTKMGGGVGYDFSDLRGSGENIGSLNRESGGPLPFITMFNSVLDGIQQGGVRRGAGMSMLSVNHKNIIDFIEAKKDYTQNNYARFNFSTKMTDLFYEKLEKTPEAKHCVLLRSGEYAELDITVQELWDKIIDHAWSSAEPGIFNETIAYDQCAVTNVSKKVLSNPCAEYINVPYTSCALGSINLEKLVEEGQFNWDRFESLIAKSTRYINNTLNQNNYPIEKIKETTLKVRAIGLGFMGLAHALYKMKIPYNSEEGYKFIEKMQHYMTLRSMKESIEIAKETGKSYPAYDEELFLKANSRLFKKKKVHNIVIQDLIDDLKKYGVANSAFTSTAPTGCRIKESLIVLDDNSIISFQEVFNQNGIDLEKIEKREKQGKFNNVSLFSNNILIKEDFYNNYSLVKISETQAKWRRNDKVKEGDTIIDIK